MLLQLRGEQQRRVAAALAQQEDDAALANAMHEMASDRGVEPVVRAERGELETDNGAGVNLVSVGEMGTVPSGEPAASTTEGQGEGLVPRVLEASAESVAEGTVLKLRVLLPKRQRTG